MLLFSSNTSRKISLTHFLRQTIISTALPTIAAGFDASESGYSWIASSYLLANAACIPLWGKISDIWGRKPIILLANVFFLVGSLICALANNMAMIIAGRAIQGVGGGGIIILANISVSDLFSMRYGWTRLKYSVIKGGLMLTAFQRSTYVLWSLWCYLGYCWCSGTYHRRCFHYECYMEVVFLAELYVAIRPKRK